MIGARASGTHLTSLRELSGCKVRHNADPLMTAEIG